MKEKRRYERFNIVLFAMCKIGDVLKKIKINNFSRSGVGIISEDFLDKGENIEFELLIPGDNIPVLLEGEIAWMDSIKTKNKQYKGGIKLKKVNNSNSSRIFEYIYKEIKK